MPYNSTADLPSYVRNKSKKKQRQWMHVWNSEYDKHKDESRAFASANSVVKKGFDTMNDFNIFLPLAKVQKNSDGSCTVSGYASTPALDLDGEIVSLDAVKAALPGYWQWRNIREMHTPSAVGVAKEANVDDTGLFLTAKIVDPLAVQKCIEGVYKGYSIGGKKLAKNGNTITEIELIEVSIVDRPANPECKIEVQKKAKTAGEAYLVKAKKIPAGKDGFSLPAGPVHTEKREPAAPEIFKDGPGSACKMHNIVGCSICGQQHSADPTDTKKKKKMKKGGDRPGEGKLPYGDVEYADNGLRADGKKRYPIDTEAHIRAAWNYINKPKNAAKYGSKVSEVKSKIISAWKSKIDSAGPPSAKKNAFAKNLAPDTFLTLGAEVNGNINKGIEEFGHGLDDGLVSGPQKVVFSKKEKKLLKRLGVAGSLSYCFDSIREAQRSLISEGQGEKDSKDYTLADKLGQVASQLANCISEKASHEAAEAVSLTDIDDEWLNINSTKVAKGFKKMSEFDEIMEALTKSRTPVMRQVMGKRGRLDKAAKDIKKARKSAKDVEECMKALHAMHKAAYMAKAAKKDKDGDTDNDMEAMKKLSKAYASMKMVKTFMKSASGNIAKAAGRSGERGQETSDPEAGFYEVPAGVKDLSPRELATAAPGTKEHGGEPPILDMMTPFPGKAAKSAYSAAEVELLTKTAKLEAENELLKSMPAGPVHGRTPHAFDVNRLNNLTAGGGKETIFKGVNLNAIGSGNEEAHKTELGKAIGNMILTGAGAKSVLDAGFQGIGPLK